MRLARRAITILTVFATGFIAAATAAYATVEATNDPAAAPVAPSTSALGLPLWQLLAFVALGVLLAVAIVGLSYSLRRSRRSQSSSRSQTPLRS
jgi:mannose/fructose/N-acetylgalactosamine-specific phosphotransferase system component IIC